MNPRPGRALFLVGVIGSLIACSAPSGGSATANNSQGSTPSPMISGEPDARLELPGAVAVNLATDGVDAPITVWTTHDGVMAAVVDLGRGEIGDQTKVSGDLMPFPHPIERPAATVGPEGEATIAFIALADGGESVYLTRWDRQQATTPEAISGPPRVETVLVHATTDPGGEAVLAWLETSTLSVGLPEDGSIVEQEEIDDLTCDCCNPAPVFAGDALVVAYRDYDLVAGQVVRDVVAKGREGDRWSGPAAIADDHWFIDACPFSGPSAVVTDNALVVAWMDARQSIHPDQAASTIWVDRSESGVEGFGTDLPVTSGGTHRWPVMEVDSTGVIHLVWETRGAQGGISYATSEDGGRSFSDPNLIVERDPDAGSPTSPSVIVHDDRLLVSWADGSGGHIAVWSIGENGRR